MLKSFLLWRISNLKLLLIFLQSLVLIWRRVSMTIWGVLAFILKFLELLFSFFCELLIICESILRLNSVGRVGLAFRGYVAVVFIGLEGFGEFGCAVALHFKELCFLIIRRVVVAYRTIDRVNIGIYGYLSKGGRGLGGMGWEFFCRWGAAKIGQGLGRLETWFRGCAICVGPFLGILSTFTVCVGVFVWGEKW
jgi:hypothetical protein